MNHQPISTPARISLIGTGFISNGLVKLLQHFPWAKLVHVLTRRDIASCKEYSRQDLLTNSLDQVINNSDLIIECTGDVIRAADIIEPVMKAGLPVVTMNAEFHATIGSHFVPLGLITETEGDQPGSQAALKEEIELMGFKPLVYGNIKWFLNFNQTPEEVAHWSKTLGIRPPQVMNFTDGTKLQVEQTLVANAFGADIAVDGLIGRESATLEEGAQALGIIAGHKGGPIVDFIRARSAPSGVFIVATHTDDQAPYLDYYKMGEGPYYTILRPYHLCHVEMPKTIKRIIDGRPPLLNNSENPTISVVSLAKRPLKAGHKIERGIGSFDVRGISIRIKEDPDHVPIGLLDGGVLKHSIEPGQRIRFSDIDLPDSLALNIWREIRDKAIAKQK